MQKMQQEVEKGQQKQTEEVQQKQQEVEKGATEADRGGATEAANGAIKEVHVSRPGWGCKPARCGGRVAGQSGGGIRCMRSCVCVCARDSHLL